jgi:hypothetical protein
MVRNLYFFVILCIFLKRVCVAGSVFCNFFGFLELFAE